MSAALYIKMSTVRNPADRKNKGEKTVHTAEMNVKELNMESLETAAGGSGRCNIHISFDEDHHEPV